MLTRLQQEVEVQQETRTPLEGGAYTTTWSTLVKLWASVQPINANETYGQEKKQQMTKYRVVMRYLSTLTNKNRFLYKGSKILVIESVTDPTNRERMMEVICRLENT